jgi:branched-chain amino acid transport system permease protein
MSKSLLHFAFVIVLAAAACSLIWSGGYLVTVLGFAAVYTIFVIGINFFMGYTGQVSFGQNAFAALGGYTSAILTTAQGWEPVVALAGAAVMAALIACLIGWPILKLRGHYLAMATLALGMISFEISVQWQSVTGGYMGLPGVPPLSIGPWELNSVRAQVSALLVIAVGFLWASWRLKGLRFGRAVGAVAGDENAAMALGINVFQYKLLAFVIAAVCASVAGSLTVHFIGFVSPEMFGLHMVILGFTMLYVGGIGTVYGPLLGAVLVSVLPEMLRALKDYQDLAYGIALILMLMFAPRGLASLADFICAKLKVTRDDRP